jgi:membrane protein DedA with SNARE-associated domain
MALVSDLLSRLHGLPEPELVVATGGLVFAECTIGLGFLAPGESGLLIAATTANIEGAVNTGGLIVVGILAAAGCSSCCA